MKNLQFLIGLKSISGLSLRSILIFCLFGSTVFITILMVFLIISVGGNFLEVLIAFLLTLIAWIVILARRFIGLDQTNGSQAAILEFFGKQPDPALYELRLIPTPGGKFRRELPLDGFWEGLLRPRVVQGWYIYIKGLHTRVGSIDITQRNIEYKTPPDDKIDLSQERGGSYITIGMASVPYWITNPVKAFYNVDNSRSIGDSNKDGDIVTGYLAELLIYFGIALVKAVSESNLKLDDLLTRAPEIGPPVTIFLREKLLENDIGVGIGNVEVSSINPSPKYLEDRDLQSSREKEEEAALLEYNFLQKQILLLMGYDNDGNRDKSKVPDEAVMTLEQILEDRHTMEALQQLKTLSVNSIGGSVEEILRNMTKIISKK